MTIPFARPVVNGVEVNIHDVTDGEACRRVEDRIKEIAGTKYAIVTNSGTSALFIAGKAVFKANSLYRRPAMQDFNWPSGKKVINYDRYVDVTENEWLVSPSSLSDEFPIIVMDTFGNQTCIPERKTPILVDAAHSFGLPMLKNATAAIYSFSPSKNFTAIEGGAIVTNNKELFLEMEKIKRWAGRMTEHNANVLLKNIEGNKVETLIEEKRKIYEYYKESLPMFQFQKITNSTYSVVGCLARSKKERIQIITALKDKVRIKNRYSCDSDLPVSNDLSDRMMLLPSYLGVDKEKVVKLIKEVLNE